MRLTRAAFLFADVFMAPSGRAIRTIPQSLRDSSLGTYRAIRTIPQSLRDSSLYTREPFLAGGASPSPTALSGTFGASSPGGRAIRSLTPGGRWIAKQDGRNPRELWYHKMTDTSQGAMAVL